MEKMNAMAELSGYPALHFRVVDSSKTLNGSHFGKLQAYLSTTVANS